MTPGQFAREYLEAFRKAAPDLKMQFMRQMELEITKADGSKFTFFLDNAYDTYKQDPGSLSEVLQKFISAGLETSAGSEASDCLDRTRIVPVIKDRPWLEETRNAMLSRGATQMFEVTYEDLNPDLIILYAEDSPKNMRYFGEKDLEKAGIERGQLKKLAIENLKRLLPEIKMHGGNGIFMITAGGDYEASLLLIDSIWSGLQKEVKGEIVAAIPTRDLLIVTGSEDPEGIAKVKQIVSKSRAKGSYRLTPSLFVYRGGKFDLFENGTAG